MPGLPDEPSEQTFCNRKSIDDQQVHFIKECEELGSVVVVIRGVTLQAWK